MALLISSRPVQRCPKNKSARARENFECAATLQSLIVCRCCVLMAKEWICWFSFLFSFGRYVCIVVCYIIILSLHYLYHQCIFLHSAMRISCTFAETSVNPAFFAAITSSRNISAMPSLPLSFTCLYLEAFFCRLMVKRRDREKHGLKQQHIFFLRHPWDESFLRRRHSYSALNPKSILRFWAKAAR